MAKSFGKGNKVEWNTFQSKTTGKILGKLTEVTEIAGRHVAASKEEPPQYLVRQERQAGGSQTRGTHGSGRVIAADDAQNHSLKEFKEAVNMTPNELERWLETDDSKEVG